MVLLLRALSGSDFSGFGSGRVGRFGFRVGSGSTRNASGRVLKFGYRVFFGFLNDLEKFLLRQFFSKNQNYFSKKYVNMA